jgi:hypothetical protein
MTKKDMILGQKNAPGVTGSCTRQQVDEREEKKLRESNQQFLNQIVFL